MTSTQLLETYEKFGLEVNVGTGGQILEADTPTVVSTPEVGNYKFHFANGEDFTFFDAALFLETVHKTEQSLNIRLFN